MVFWEKDVNDGVILVEAEIIRSFYE